MRLFATGLALGVVAAITAGVLVPEPWPLLPSALLIAAVFAVSGAVGGYFLKDRVGTVGLLVLAPLGLLLLTSVAFAGNLAAFVRHDLLPLVGAAAGAFGGAHLGARLQRRAGRAV